jgi:hypothetical protein
MMARSHYAGITGMLILDYKNLITGTRTCSRLCPHPPIETSYRIASAILARHETTGEEDIGKCGAVDTERAKP